MRGIHSLVVLVVLAGVVRAEESEPFSAAEVASWCEPYRTAVITGDKIAVRATAASRVCYGAFVAIQQLMGSSWGTSPGSILRTCEPPTSGLVELIKVFLLYVDQHPERGHEKFTDIALVSLWKAYPCATTPSAKP
jgi:hypothetical protein